MTTVTLLKQQHRNVLDHLTEPMTQPTGTAAPIFVLQTMLWSQRKVSPTQRLPRDAMSANLGLGLA
jgi:hypothetical protein